MNTRQLQFAGTEPNVTPYYYNPNTKKYVYRNGRPVTPGYGFGKDPSGKAIFSSDGNTWVYVKGTRVPKNVVQKSIIYRHPRA
jgi:hypothetical protein